VFSKTNSLNQKQKKTAGETRAAFGCVGHKKRETATQGVRKGPPNTGGGGRGEASEVHMRFRKNSKKRRWGELVLLFGAQRQVRRVTPPNRGKSTFSEKKDIHQKVNFSAQTFKKHGEGNLVTKAKGVGVHETWRGGGGGKKKGAEGLEKEVARSWDRPSFSWGGTSFSGGGALSGKQKGERWKETKTPPCPKKSAKANRTVGESHGEDEKEKKGLPHRRGEAGGWGGPEPGGRKIKSYQRWLTRKGPKERSLKGGGGKSPNQKPILGRFQDQ